MGRSEHFLEGWHGRTDGRNPTDVPDLFVAPGREHADDYADGEQGALYRVQYAADNPLHLRRADEFHHAWTSSRADEAVGDFHPHTTRRFTAWAREKGHDAVVVHPSVFDDPDAEHEHWETATGSLGEPQTIILKPKAAKVERVR